MLSKKGFFENKKKAFLGKVDMVNFEGSKIKSKKEGRG